MVFLDRHRTVGVNCSRVLNAGVALHAAIMLHRPKIICIRFMYRNSLLHGYIHIFI